MNRYPTVALRYAQSLAALSAESGSLDALYKDMTGIAETYRSDAEFRSFLKSPVINVLTKIAILEKMFAGKTTDLTLAFIKKIASARREYYLGDIANAFISHYKKLKGVLSIYVTSAAPLSSDVKNQIIEIVKHNNEYAKASSFELIEKVDKSIIGGLIVQVDDRQVDASFSSKFNQLRQAFSENLYEKEF